jgi:hypothetical protein
MAGCGTHHYDNISRAKIEIMLHALISRGCIITGHNPWDVVTRQHGVMLRGEWDEAALTLAVTVTDASWYVPCETAWKNINALMRQVQEPGIELEIEIA